MLSMFTAMATNAMNTALDGTICKDIDDKEVSGTKSQKLSSYHSQSKFLY